MWLLACALAPDRTADPAKSGDGVDTAVDAPDSPADSEGVDSPPDSGGPSVVSADELDPAVRHSGVALDLPLVGLHEGKLWVVAHAFGAWALPLPVADVDLAAVEPVLAGDPTLLALGDRVAVYDEGLVQLLEADGAPAASWTTGGAGGILLGDLDADGVEDLVVGAGYLDQETRLVSDAGAGGDVSTGWRVDSDEGWVPARPGGAEDLDGDGVADLLVGSTDWTTYNDYPARAWIFSGPILEDRAVADADADFRAASGASAVARPLGDLDGDGLTDLGVAVYDLHLLSAPFATSTSLEEAPARVPSIGEFRRAGADLLVADPAADLGSLAGAGLAWRVAGPYTGVVDLQHADLRIEGSSLMGGFGADLVVGDAEGDGLGLFFASATTLPGGVAVRALAD